MPTAAPLVRVVRSGLVESVHLGHVVVCDREGRVRRRPRRPGPPRLLALVDETAAGGRVPAPDRRAAARRPRRDHVRLAQRRARPRPGRPAPAASRAGCPNATWGARRTCRSRPRLAGRPPDRDGSPTTARASTPACSSRASARAPSSGRYLEPSPPAPARDPARRAFAPPASSGRSWGSTGAAPRSTGSRCAAWPPCSPGWPGPSGSVASARAPPGRSRRCARQPYLVAGRGRSDTRLMEAVPGPRLQGRGGGPALRGRPRRRDRGRRADRRRERPRRRAGVGAGRSTCSACSTRRSAAPSHPWRPRPCSAAAGPWARSRSGSGCVVAPAERRVRPHSARPPVRFLDGQRERHDRTDRRRALGAGR